MFIGLCSSYSLNFKSFYLSLTQSLTEFFPVSSSIHLELMIQFFNKYTLTLEEKVSLHLGTLLALCLYFYKDIYHCFKFVWHLLCCKDYKALLKRFPLQFSLILATLPAIITGYQIKTVSGEITLPLSLSVLIGACFGICLYASDIYGEKNKPLTFWRAFVIGCFQILAFIPGVSRSGICLTASRLVGLSRTQAIHFSFLLAIPTIFGAVVLTILPLLKQETFIKIKLLELSSLTFILSLAIIHLAFKYMERYGFFSLMIYRIFVLFLTLYGLKALKFFSLV